MKNKSFVDFVRRTPFYLVYSHFSVRRSLRKQAKHFWEWSAEDQRRFDFYRQFVDPGDVVFDVGANLGNRAKIFSRLNATVVAVEPQTVCANFLFTVFGSSVNFHLVRKALGASTGQAEMLICNASTISSLSLDWIQAVKDSGRFAGYEWKRKVAVPVDTLDNLVAEYGCPSFVKIDVEGFEDKVVSGLSTPVGALSMEFTPEFIGSTLNCISHLCRLGDCRFQISLGESMEFILPRWVTADEARKALSEISPTVFGDLYACFDTPQGSIQC